MTTRGAVPGGAGAPVLVDLRRHRERGLGAERVTGDPLVALDALLEPFDDAILGHGDDRRRTGIHALSDRLQVLVLEALVAHLAPDRARAAADRGRGQDRGREDQPYDAAGDRASLGPLLPARVGRLLEPHLPVLRAHDDGG